MDIIQERMRTLSTYLLLSFLSIASVSSQTMKKMTQLQEFESRLAKEAQTVQSIESDFTQVKYGLSHRHQWQQTQNRLRRKEEHHESEFQQDDESDARYVDGLHDRRPVQDVFQLPARIL